MDPLSFIVAMTTALVWPLAAIVICLVLRREIGKLLPYIEEINYKDINIKLQSKLRQVRKIAPATSSSLRTIGLLPKTTPQYQSLVNLDLKTPDYTFDPLIELAQSSPNAAIDEAWNEHEQSIRMLAEQLKIPHDLNAPILYLVEAIKDAAKDKSETGAIKEVLEECTPYLWQVRNQTAYTSSKPSSISIQTARNYIDLASSATSILMQWADAHAPRDLKKIHIS